MKVATVFTLLVGASATDCSPGYKHKKVLTNLKCKSASTTATLQGKDNCNTNCCELNTKTCGGLAASTTCTTPAKYYLPTGTQQTDAWKSTATTSTKAGTDCCLARATCGGSSYSCPAGFEKDTTKNAVYCTSDAKSCAVGTTCCKAVKTQCLQTPALVETTVCGAATTGFVFGSKLCGTDTKTNKACIEAWGKTKIVAAAATPTVAEQKTSCCTVAPTCYSLKGSFKCDAGKKFKTTITAAADTKLTTFPVTSTAFNTDCCQSDTNTCLGISATVSCPSGSFKDTNLNGRSIKDLTTAAQKNARCCSAAAKCSNYACPKGYKAKKSAASTSCGGSVSSCVKTTCCEVDLTTCGGNFPNDATAITCATGFYDERTFWKSQADADADTTGKIKATTQAVKDAWYLKNTSATTKTKECCSPVANCTNITTAAVAGLTTTPAAVVTTTPTAAPALKFSEHKIATEKSSGSNMVWVGVGAFVGMGVLMFVQHVRSERSSRMMGLSEESLE